MSNVPKTIDLDAVLLDLGSIGTYQIRVFAYLMFTVVFTAIYNNEYVFTAGPVNYRCLVPACEATPVTYKDGPWRKFALPPDGKCYRYKVIGTTCDASSFSNQIEKCDSWVYEDAHTISTEFNLACQEWKRALVGTIRNFGYFCTMPFVTYFSDLIGRRKVLIFTAVSPSVVGIARSYCTSYYPFLALQFVEAFVCCGAYSTVFILALEMVNFQTRVIGGCVIANTYCGGLTILGIFSSYVPYWRTRSRIIYVPSMFFIIYIWIGQESIRWLIARGKLKEAAIIILRVAAINKADLHYDTIQTLQYFAEQKPVKAKLVSSKESSSTSLSDPPEVKQVPIYKQLLKSRVIVGRMLVCSFWWITVTTVYFGVTINSVSLTGNQYMNFVLTSLIETPGYISTVLTLDHFGRKASMMTAFLVCGISLLSIGAVTNPKIIMALSMVGKLGISVIFCSIYIYTIELFPTSARHLFIGFCSMVGRCGAMIAPQTPLLMKYGYYIPYLIFGVMACTSGLLMLFTPETLKVRLPDTVEEAENIGVLPRVSRIRTDILSVKR